MASKCMRLSSVPAVRTVFQMTVFEHLGGLAHKLGLVGRSDRCTWCWSQSPGPLRRAGTQGGRYQWCIGKTDGNTIQGSKSGNKQVGCGGAVSMGTQTDGAGWSRCGGCLVQDSMVKSERAQFCLKPHRRGSAGQSFERWEGRRFPPSRRG